MRTELVKNMAPLHRFIYWVRERHQVYLRRRAGKPRPWTDDEILQGYFFTNPYRENDKTTKWFRRTIRNPLRDDRRVLFATIIFRWFNYIPTGTLLWGEGLLTQWDHDAVLSLLGSMRAAGRQVFTGAFMINSPPREGKLEAICRRIQQVWEDRDALEEALWPGRGGQLTMQAAHATLTRYEGLGGFMAYEIACDLRYTKYLEHAPDKCTWSNPGPGAIRGLLRLLNLPFDKGNNSYSPRCPADYQEQTQGLLYSLQERLPVYPAFEMREVEHCLCEWDKYERLLWGDGKAKRRYDGGAP